MEEQELGLPDQEQEFFEHYHFIVDKGQSPLRIDKYLMLRVQNASRNKIQAAATVGSIRVNEKPVKSNYKVKPADEISIVLPDPPRDTTVYPENIPLNIIYEDAALLIVNKNAGMVVHPGYNNYNGTLVNALAWHFDNLPTSQNGTSRPGLVHRIDKDTTGLLVISKTEEAMAALASQFYYHSLERTYQALVWGNVESDEGTITGNLGRNPRDRLQMMVFQSPDEGKPAITHYKVINRYHYVTLVECRLETGRTHQIRAHMKYLGHPIFNDATYGGDKILKGTVFTKYKQFVANCFTLMPRQALHAKTLGFIHPSTGKMVRFDSDLPDDFKALLLKWATFTKDLV